MQKNIFFIVPLIIVLYSCAGALISRDARIEFEQGLALFDQGRYEEAVPRFQKASVLGPRYTEAYVYLGRSYLNLGKWAEAIAPLRTAYRLAPEETRKEAVNFLLDALIGGALSEFKKENYTSSTSYLKEALGVDPLSDTARNELVKSLIALGGKLVSEGRSSEAVTAFSEAVEIAPKNLDAYLGLARAFLKTGDYASAMHIVNDAVKKIATSDVERAAFWDLVREN
ncbi:MAG: tetratricopeptide repeat protein [Nitrospirae bacterium]|nr:tetratricopeptide repeat protein [Nitrospirota bacterium]